MKAMKTMETRGVRFYDIVKETEKAILFHLPVSWGDGALKEKELWMPKSVVASINGNWAEVATWFIRKTEDANSFHGYSMNLEVAAQPIF